MQYDFMKWKVRPSAMREFNYIGKLIQKWEISTLCPNQTHYLGSTMPMSIAHVLKFYCFFFLDLQLKRFSRNKPHNLTQKGAFFEFWAQLLNVFWIRSSSSFPGISRISWPKMAQKGAFFKIFKPIICAQAQLCAYGKFLDPQLKWFSRNKPHKLTKKNLVEPISILQ